MGNLRVISSVPINDKLIRVNFSDGSDLALTAETVELFELYDGAEVFSDTAEITRDSDSRRVTSAALSALAYKSHTFSQLRSKLVKSYSEEIVDEVMPRLIELGLINDEEYAVSFASDCIKLKSWGDMRIMREMRQRGIDNDTAETAIETAREDGYSETECLKALICKKYSHLTDEKSRKHAFDALIRLGYRFGEIKKALNITDYETDD